ncbi:MAG: hypothetical protein PQJ60_07055, partial [Spirochaetales bacterium]|nr:hypothetical protein [Spirochaetales bacterium]
MRNEVFNKDCMDYMRELPKNCFDLALCDPPYGIKANKPRTGFKNCPVSKNSDDKSWDNSRMPKEWVDEIFRVSRFQIIFGYQYYSDLLPPTKGMIVWDKKNKESIFSDGEAAFQNIKKSLRIFPFKWNGFLQEDMENPEERIHPTQKPVALYKWILKKFA